MKRISTIILAMMFTATTYAQMLAVNTDVAMDLLMAPSLGLELTTGDHSTISLNAIYGPKAMGKNIKVAAVQPEWRFYPTGRPMHSFFIGAGAILGMYDIEWAGKKYDGNAVGAGVTFGYVWSLTEHLNIDFHAGFGAEMYSHKEYYVGDAIDLYEQDGHPLGNAKGYYLLPTRFGISVSYILK